MSVFVSVPPGAARDRASEWEAAIAARIPAGRSVVVICDEVGGELRQRSAYMVSGEIGDFGAPVEEILDDAGLVERKKRAEK